MEKIHVKVDWCDKNYGAVTECEALNGVVTVTNKTYDGLMADLGEAVRFHVEGCVADGDEMPEWLVSASGISQQQLSHYANGLRSPRPEQRRRIVEGIHRIGKECLEVV